MSLMWVAGQKLGEDLFIRSRLDRGFDQLGLLKGLP